MLTRSDVAAEIAAEGRDVVVQRTETGSVPVTATVTAMVRGYKAAELLGGIVQGDRRVVIAGTALEAASFPLPFKKGDVVVIDGKRTAVQAADAVYLRDELAKVVLQVRG